MLELRLVRAVIDKGHDSHQLLDTYAWALFANGRHDEALAQAEAALANAPADDQEVFNAILDRMRQAVEASRGSR